MAALESYWKGVSTAQNKKLFMNIEKLKLI